MSAVGVLGIYSTAITFSKWRHKSTGKITLHFATSILLQMVVMLTIDVDDDFRSKITDHRIGCIAMAVALHYSVLANFFWMLIVSYFQYQRYVIVFNKYHVQRIVLKSAIIGWGFPVIPVAIILLHDCTMYIPVDRKHLCYPTGHAFHFGLMLPLALILVCNATVFGFVVCSIFKGTKLTHSKTDDLMRSKLRLLAFLFFVLGMTWIFGLLSGVGERNSLIFAYLFCFSATMQGLVLFAYSIVLDGVTRNLWSTLMRKCWDKEWRNQRRVR